MIVAKESKGHLGLLSSYLPCFRPRSVSIPLTHALQWPQI